MPRQRVREGWIGFPERFDERPINGWRIIRAFEAEIKRSRAEKGHEESRWNVTVRWRLARLIRGPFIPRCDPFRGSFHPNSAGVTTLEHTLRRKNRVKRQAPVFSTSVKGCSCCCCCCCCCPLPTCGARGTRYIFRPSTKTSLPSSWQKLLLWVRRYLKNDWLKMMWLKRFIWK